MFLLVRRNRPMPLLSHWPILPYSRPLLPVGPQSGLLSPPEKDFPLVYCLCIDRNSWTTNQRRKQKQKYARGVSKVHVSFRTLAKRTRSASHPHHRDKFKRNRADRRMRNNECNFIFYLWYSISRFLCAHLRNPKEIECCSLLIEII